MHHIKHIKTINVKLSKFDQMAARVNRKQIPLCQECHKKVHQGKYQGMSLKHFIYLK
jgi:predicted HNH restriction endonuclease